MDNQNKFELEAYLDRIEYEGSRQPSWETLRGLQAAHLIHIPFENIDVALHREVRIDLDSVQEKLVRNRRGGYCFEQNTLFAAALGELGFELDTLEARVRPPGETEPLPRTHMVLRVLVDRKNWLVDVGFGGDGSLEPVAFDGNPSLQSCGDYRLICESAGVHVLQWRRKEHWTDLYALGQTPALPIDYVVANHFTSTHPESVFRRVVTVQRFETDRRHILRNQVYTIRLADSETVREIERGDLPDLIRDVFGLQLSNDEVYAALDQNS